MTRSIKCVWLFRTHIPNRTRKRYLSVGRRRDKETKRAKQREMANQNKHLAGLKSQRLKDQERQQADFAATFLRESHEYLHDERDKEEQRRREAPRRLLTEVFVLGKVPSI